MSTTPSERAARSAFEASLGGGVIVPGDPTYEQARLVWNAVADRRPAMIVRCTSVEDVVKAIRHAREHQLTAAIRGGGHSVAGFSTCDGGMVIDLSRMREVTVDPVRKRATTQGGAHLSQLDQAAQEHGLVCPVGVVGHTGVAGLTLGGGMGRLQRKFGLTVDNLVAVDLVTADGEQVHASEDENPDLFWGLRGAGANFGVSTKFEFRLHPLDGAIFHGLVAYPIARSQEIAERAREFVETHNDVDLSFGFSRVDELGGQPMVTVALTDTGPAERAERYLQPLRKSSPLKDTFGPKAYLAVQLANDDYMSWGKRFYMKSGFLPELTDAVVVVCCELAETIPPSAELSLVAHGGAVGCVSDDAMAYTGRTAAFNASAELLWTDPADDESRIAWGREALARLAPFIGTSRYVNEVVEAGTDAAQIYGQAKYDRLVALKRKYDPDNFFRLNQNIKP